MKNIGFVVFLAAVMACSLVVSVHATAQDSKIVSVTVYSDRAMVTRSAEVDLQSGANEVTIGNLPAFIIEESIRAGVKQAGAKITGIQVKKIFLEGSIEERIKKLESEIRKLEDLDKELLDKKGVLESSRKFLESFARYSSEKVEKEMALQKMDLQTWKDALNFMSTSMNKANEDLQGIAAEQRSVKEKLQALHRERAQIGYSKNLEKKVVTVTIEADKKTRSDLALSYVVMGARWSPEYDARALTSSKEIELVYKAAVSQNTGEDWDGVELVLSTAKPVVGAKAPELQPWYINIVEPVLSMKNFDALGVGRSQPMMKEEKATIANQVAAYSVPVTNMVSMVFNIQKKGTIPSDGSSHKVTIAKELLKSAFEYVAVPKITPLAFLRTEVENSSLYTFLAGPVNVFQDIDYVGRSILAQVVPGDTFVFDLGVDENIKCKRDLLGKKKEFLLFGKERIRYSYRITVESFKKTTEKITIIDQIPVSQDERVAIKILKIVPDQVSDEKGEIKWEFQINPGEKKELYLDFCIDYPKGIIVSGL